MMPVKIRHVLFSRAAVLAARLNGAAYELAIKANRLQGWLLRHRDAPPSALFSRIREGSPAFSIPRS